MKLMIMFALLFSLLSISSCGKKENKDQETNDKIRMIIQKNTSFTGSCDYLETSIPMIIYCPKGAPACGTKPGEGKLTVYCIDENDNILFKAICVAESDKSHAGSPICEQIISTP